MKNNKYIMLICIFVVIVGLVCFFLFKKNKNTDNSENTDNNASLVEHIEDLVELEDLDEITVVSARIEKIDSVYSIFVKIKNNTHEKIGEQDLLLTIKDKDGNELLSTPVRGIVGIDVGEETEFQTMTKVDIRNAKTYIVSK